MFHAGRSTAWSAWRNSGQHLPTQPFLHIVWAVLAASALCSLLSWWQSIQSPGISFMNSYEVAFFHLDLLQWILIIHPNIGLYIYSYYISTSWFQILFHSLPRPFSVFMLSSITLTLLAIELSTNLISIFYMIFFFLYQFQLRASWFFNHKS